MTSLLILRWIHLVAAATWMGGLITLSALVVALRQAGAEREVLLAAARAFGRLSWTAMAVAVATGLAQVWWLGLPWAYDRLQAKVALVAVAIAIAAGHQLTAARSSPRVRGVVQVLIVVASLAVFGAAVAL